MSEQLHVPPWQIMDECTAEWWEWMNEWNHIKVKAQQQAKAGKHGK
jgi:hypothetical protein